MIIAVDFDGTLCTNKYPQIGEPNKQLFQILINKQKAGDIIILNTCRHGIFLEQAIDFCKSNGLKQLLYNKALDDFIAFAYLKGIDFSFVGRIMENGEIDVPIRLKNIKDEFLELTKGTEE